MVLLVPVVFLGPIGPLGLVVWPVVRANEVERGAGAAVADGAADVAVEAPVARRSLMKLCTAPGVISCNVILPKRRIRISVLPTKDR